MSEIQSVNNYVASVFDQITAAKYNNASSIANVWKNVLGRIQSKKNPNEGEKLWFHSKIVDLKQGVLIVEVDHPGWIELFQLRRNYILKGLQMELKDINISTIAFKLQSEINKSMTPEEKTQSTLKNIEDYSKKQEEMLKNAGINTEMNSTEKKELPEELQSIFADLKQSMLTNPKK